MKISEFRQKEDLHHIPKKRHPLLMVLGLVIIVLISVIVIVQSNHGSSPLQLGTIQSMSKGQVINLLGAPNEVVVDNDQHYSFGYDKGILLSGTEQGVYELFAQQDMIKKGTKADYEIFGVGLGSSFDNNINRLGEPNLTLTADQKKTAIYILEDVDYLFTLATSYNSDLITSIQYASYNDSLVSTGLDLGKLFVREFSEERLNSNYRITDQNSSPNGVFYTMQGFNVFVDKQNVVQNIHISTESIYNFRGLRIRDNLEKANQIFGDPTATSEGVLNTTRYTYTYEEGPNKTCLITISIDNESKQIQYLEVQITSQPTYLDQSSQQLETDEELATTETEESPASDIIGIAPQDLWDTLTDYQKTEFNQYFSLLSEVDFGTNPYIKDSDIQLYSSDELIKFAIAYNIQHFEDRYGLDSENEDYMSISDSYISDTIIQLFNIDISHKSVSGYDYNNGKYLWDSYRWAKIDVNTFSQVETLTDNGNQTYTAEISIYRDNIYNSTDYNIAWYEPKESAWVDDSQYSYIGSAKATIKDHSDGFILTHYEVISMY